MKALLNLRGIVTVLNTPFTKTNEVDIEAIRKNVRYAIHSGVAGFLVPAMASEVEKLAPAEKIAIVRAVLDETKGKVQVIGGASAGSVEERLSNVRTMIDLGCDGVLVSVPYQSDSQYRHEVEQLANAEPPFLMLQDWTPTGYGVPVPLIVKLFENVDKFRAIKVEVVPAGMKYTELIQATQGRLHVSGGWAVTQLIEGLDRGVHAFMPTGLHYIYSEIFRRFHNQNRDGAVDLFRKIVPVLGFSNQHLDISIHFFKRLMWRQGIYPTANVRPPILPFDSYHERMANELINYILPLEKMPANLK